MNKKWFYIEKGISILQIVFGLLIMVVVANSIYQNRKYLQKYLEDEWVQLSTISMIENTWYMATASLLLVIGGISLFISKRTGWFLSTCAWIMYVYSMFTFLFWRDVTTTSFYEDTTEYFIIGGFLLLMIFILILLGSKPIREKYDINGNSWIMISTVVLISIFVKYII